MNKNLERILDYIMNQADQGELELIDAALKRKMKKPFTGIDGMDFKEMAREAVSDLSSKFGAGTDINGMTRRLVTNMILQQYPNMSMEELEILLDKWVPTPDRIQKGREDTLPPDVIYTMAMQFVNYSLGRMPDSEVRDLKESMHDWTTRYWEIFGMDTKLLIKELLGGNLDLQEFQAGLMKNLGLTPG